MHEKAKPPTLIRVAAAAAAATGREAQVVIKSCLRVQQGCAPTCFAALPSPSSCKHFSTSKRNPTVSRLAAAMLEQAAAALPLQQLDDVRSFNFPPVPGNALKAKKYI